MPATRRVRKSSGTSEPEQYLPVDLLLEIVARSDVTTVVRCTAASRILRRAIVDPAFRRRLAADGGGFDPALLLGVSYRALIRDMDSAEHAHRVIHTPPSTKPRVLLDESNERDSFDPMASGDGLLLLRRYDLGVELRVCDTLTGQATPLPQIALSSTFGHVFLSVGDAAESYELVVADMLMQFQTFYSKHGRWGPVRQVSITEHQTETHLYRLGGVGVGIARPAVVGRTVYWPCRRYDNWVCWDLILAMDVNTAAGTIMELPPGRMMARNKDTHLLLASVCGFLSLLVVESGGISMWTLAPASSPRSTAVTWSRQLVIGKVEIEKVLGHYDGLHLALEGFGQRSGAVIVLVGNVDLLRLDLGTKVLKRLLNQEHMLVTRLFLHETDLVSLLQAMKCF